MSTIRIPLTACLSCDDVLATAGTKIRLTLKASKFTNYLQLEFPAVVTSVEIPNASDPDNAQQVLIVEFGDQFLPVGTVQLDGKCDISNVRCESCCDSLNDPVIAEDDPCADLADVANPDVCVGLDLVRSYLISGASKQVTLQNHPSCLSVNEDAGLGGIETPVSIVSQICVGSVQVTTYSDGSTVNEQNAAGCLLPADAALCVGELCLNIELGKVYFFRNTGGVTFNDIMAPASATFQNFKTNAGGSNWRSFIGDPRIPVSEGGAAAADIYHPQDGANFLGFPEEWIKVGNVPPGDSQGAVVPNEWLYLISASAANFGIPGQLCLPAGLDYYGSLIMDAGGNFVTLDGTDINSYLALPWNVDTPVSLPEVTCS